MKCPFLRETTVGSCEASPFRKMIPRSVIQEDEQKCSSPAYVNCPAAKAQLQAHPGPPAPRCPFFRESLVQHCTAISPTKFIPYNDDLLSRCNSDAHRYCQLYLQRSHPECPERRSDGASKRPADPAAQAIPLPERLAYARNHMWLDVSEDGSCHVGVDAFLTRVLGAVERESFVSEKGFHRPAVVLRVGGVDLLLTFPLRMNITQCNTLLRSKPERLVEDPYGAGWLFEGTASENGRETSINEPQSRLLRGESAAAWMREEAERMTEFVHGLLTQRCHQGEKLVADGGCFSSELAQYLNHEELLTLFNLFFVSRVG